MENEQFIFILKLKILLFEVICRINSIRCKIVVKLTTVFYLLNPWKQFRSMKKVLLFLILSPISLIHYGQIIADHSVVDSFDDIPQVYINEVKKMWLTVPGESHSGAYRTGLELLEAAYPVFDAAVGDGGYPDPYTTLHLRANRAMWGDYNNSSGWIHLYGEGDWFTNTTAITRTKAGITYCNTHSLIIAAIGFAWCNDATTGAPAADADPLYGVHWSGVSVNGPDGSKAWGIDAADYAETGNTVNMDTYLKATQEYIDHCTANSYPTKVFFTTGTVESYNTEEPGYQGYLKYEHIRDYVKADPTRILFDYADILCYDDDGTPATTTWNGHIYPVITINNAIPAVTGHISNAGALRLAKAMWWMLARIAGWDGGTAIVPVAGITVAGSGGAITITTDNGTLQLRAAVSPSNATNQTVTWSLVNGTGQASIDASGIVTAITNGTVTARATANDGSEVSGTLAISISNQGIPVTGIAVTGAGGATIITADDGTLQLSATVTPTNATNQTVTWSLVNGTGQASIDASGIVTAITNGTVTARATANDGSEVSGTLAISISNQGIPVTGIAVTGAGGATIITTDDGTLQLSATVTPANATDQSVAWSIVNDTGEASISSSGLITAIAHGTVTARATANDGSGVYGSLSITISYSVSVTGIEVTGEGGIKKITKENGTLQLNAAVTPTNATNQTVTWSIINGTGQATINTSGLVTAIANGTVTAWASANDETGIFGKLSIRILKQVANLTGTTNGTEMADGQTTITPAELVTSALNDGTFNGIENATDISEVSGSLDTKTSRIKPMVAVILGNEIKVTFEEDYSTCRLGLFDYFGYQIKSTFVDGNSCTFEISSVRPGIYFMVLTNNKVLKVGKVIIP
jgi:uncharacterized protein YjdB